MTTFSVLVSGYKAQGHLRECLKPVCLQSVTDLKLTAVTDRFPDGCGDTIDTHHTAAW